MRRSVLAMLFVALAVAALFAFDACRGGGGVSSATTGGSAAVCTTNTAPALSSAEFYVDGVAAGSDPSFMETQTVSVYLSYSDVDCNLPGGKIEYAVDAKTDTTTTK